MPKYLLWGRSLTQADALWFALPQSPMSLAQAEHLHEYYSSEWPNQYEYKIVLKGFIPGNCEPAFV